MNQTTGLEFRLSEISGRIKELREIENLSREDLARKTGVTLEEYIACETGKSDLNFAFLYRCALALGVDVTDIIEGASPKLTGYTVTRRGAGQRVEQAHGMVYYNLASQFKNRIAEPLYVNAAFSEEAQYKDIELTSHAGQECDIVISGRLCVQVGTHRETLEPGDSIYYDSSTPHGMIAVGGQDCLFYAIVLNPSGEPVPELTKTEAPMTLPEKQEEPAPAPVIEEKEHIWQRYIDVLENSDGSLRSISFKNADNFNFAFDIVDEMAKLEPDKLAMLHISRDKTERRFTFADISRLSNRAANYFKSLGIKKGDRVLLMLRRHWQFWVAMMALNKLGAVAILCANQMLKKDLAYRFQKAGVSTVLCTATGDCANQVELAAAESPTVKNLIIVDGEREGWRNFDEEFRMFRSTYTVPEEGRPGGEDLMFMIFTSGTTGYPKIATHTYTYALAHFVTAHYWHRVKTDGLHLTISDTGWAKSMWGKLYGQWLSEGAIFVYDFDRFDASDLLPMFKKYNITTFCAPPTMYRFMIKEDLSKYDLSSIKHATIAGEALNPEVFYQFQKATGLSVMEGFGQSETTMMIGNTVGMTPKVGSMGKPVPLYDVDIVNAEGKSCGVGETGEIVIRVEDGLPFGLCRGYYDGELGKPVLDTHDGMYHTGDTAWRDEDGYYWYVGRVDDVIKSSGYRIGPFEIESVIMELPYVLECGVSAAPDEIRGQVVKASIVLTKGTEPTEELKKEIQNYVKHKTAPYKYPRIVVFKDELPKTTSGKIIRSKL